MPNRLSAVRRILLSHGYGQGSHRATVALEHLDPRAVAGWVYWKLGQRQLGEVKPADIRRIKVSGSERSVTISGEPYAVDQLRRLVQELDKNAAGAISLACLPVETTQPQRLLCQPRAIHLVEMPDGSQIDTAAEAVDVAKLCPVEPDFADEMVVIVNPYVDPDAVEEMVVAGMATIGDEPRLIERKGLAGTVTFECEHTMPSGRAGLRLATLVGSDGLMTVQASIRCSGCRLDSPLARGRTATVQYVAYPGQTVALGAVPATGTEGATTVLLVTADTVDVRAHRKAHGVARKTMGKIKR